MKMKSKERIFLQALCNMLGLRPSMLNEHRTGVPPPPPIPGELDIDVNSHVLEVVKISLKFVPKSSIDNNPPSSRFTVMAA